MDKLNTLQRSIQFHRVREAAMVKILLLIGALCSMTVTRAGPPGPPRDVKIEETCGSITLTWQHPLDNGGMPIINYVITILLDGNVLQIRNVDWPARMHKFSFRFEPETSYELRLKARNEPGTGNEEILFITANEFCVPGKATITNKEINVYVDFIVTWTKPAYDGGGANLTYRLEWRKKPSDNNTEVAKRENIQETRSAITGLEYESEYEVKLFAVNSAGDSEADTKHFKTKKEPVSPSAEGPDLVMLISSSSLAVLCIILVILVRIAWSLRRNTPLKKDLRHRAKKSDQPEEYEEIELSPPAMMVPSDSAQNPDNVQASSAFSHISSRLHAPIEGEKDGEYENFNQTKTLDNANKYLPLTDASNLEMSANNSRTHASLSQSKEEEGDNP